MEFRVSVTYERSMAFEAARAYSLRAIGWVMPLATLLLVFGLGELLSAGDRSWLVGVGGTILVLGLAVAVATFVAPYRRALATFDRMASHTAEFVFDEDHLSVSSDLGQQQFAWRVIERVMRRPRIWFLVLRGATYITLPTAELSPDAQAFIQQQVVKHGGRVR